MTMSDEQWIKRYEDRLVYLYDISRESAQNLVLNYGTRALAVAEAGVLGKSNVWIDENFPYLESEVAYAVWEEFAVKPNDILARWFGIRVLNEKAS